jgi:uncharacterized membrane-anchored protein YhcB (DUF1043 family)
MMWLLGVVCLLAGIVIGAMLYKFLRSDEVRVQQLEDQLQSLSDEYENYKKDVHAHFGDSAQLLNKLTESYKDVYQHLAQGARTLCPDYIATQITQAASMTNVAQAENPSPRIGSDNKIILSPPLDYAAPENRQTPSLLSPAPENNVDKF